jgi:hypothetical protein
MREVFSRIEEWNIPLRKRELLKLSLEDSDPDCPGGFVVREARSRWDKQRNRFTWDEIQKLCAGTIHEARLRYADRRLQLKDRGFQNISFALEGG